jgi:(R,R)-butanediol dehydrogenase/meso-butanediol dehydrogenase/diacetyl reductase
MSKMKAVLYMKNQNYELATVDVPVPVKDHIKIKVKYCAMCATDAHMVSQDLYNRPKGFGLGHELSGTIDELGEGTEKYGFEVGDPVAVFPLYHCGKCEFCKKGMTQYCIEKPFRRFPGFAEYAVAHVSQVFKVPRDEDIIKYALVEPITCAIRGIDLANIQIGQNVAISGVGGIGLILLNMILLQGGANITVIEPVASKRETALVMGAKHAIDPGNEDIIARADEITGGNGFDVVFEASGVPQAAPPCLKITGLCSRIIYFAVYPMDYELPLNLYDLYMKESKIFTSYTRCEDAPRAVRIIPRMNMDLIIGKIYGLKDIDKVFEDFKKSIYPKILVDCQDI